MLAIRYVNTAVNTGLDDTPALSTQHKGFLVSTRVPDKAICTAPTSILPEILL